MRDKQTRVEAGVFSSRAGVLTDDSQGVWFSCDLLGDMSRSIGDCSPWSGFADTICTSWVINGDGKTATYQAISVTRVVADRAYCISQNNV